MAFRVKFWGTRGSIPTPGLSTWRYGGNTSCVEIRVNDTLIICDGGTGMRALGEELTSRGGGSIVGHLLFSHTHWDHIQGFPFFDPLYGKDHAFFVYGALAGQNKVVDLLSGQMSSEAYFPVNFRELDARLESRDLGEGDALLDGVRVRCFEQIHPGSSYAFSFTSLGWKVVYATDYELDKALPDFEQTIRDPMAPREVPQEFVDFVRGADLLIGDGQYTDEEYRNKVGWGHARATTMTDVAIRAGVKQLALFHHDPMQSDLAVDDKVGTCRDRAIEQGSDLVVFGAREGLQLRIDRVKRLHHGDTLLGD